MMARFSGTTCRRCLPALGALALALAAACGDAATATPASDTTPPASIDVAIRPILATTVLRVGSQRVSFLLSTAESLIKAPEATVSSVFLGDGTAAGEEKRAAFHLWPYGVRGAYSTELTFGRSGPWRLDIRVEGPEGPAEVELNLEVAQQVGIPEIGANAIADPGNLWSDYFMPIFAQPLWNTLKIVSKT